MVKAVKKKVNKRNDASLEIETPYPEEEKKKQKKSDIDFWGEKMVKLQDRVNELELSINDMNLKLGKVASRLGM
jgi:hypothetical protein